MTATENSELNECILYARRLLRETPSSKFTSKRRSLVRFGPRSSFRSDPGRNSQCDIQRAIIKRRRRNKSTRKFRWPKGTVEFRHRREAIMILSLY